MFFFVLVDSIKKFLFLRKLKPKNKIVIIIIIIKQIKSTHMKLETSLLYFKLGSCFRRLFRFVLVALLVVLAWEEASKPKRLVYKSKL